MSTAVAMINLTPVFVCRITVFIPTNIRPRGTAIHYCLNDSMESKFGPQISYFDGLISSLHVLSDAFPLEK